MKSFFLLLKFQFTLETNKQRYKWKPEASSVVKKTLRVLLHNIST